MNVLHFCRSSNWGTPPEWIERVRYTLGTIDLDPCSSESHNERVNARDYYDEKENGLLLPWRGRVFCNPPGGRGVPQKFFAKLQEELVSGRCTEAVYLAYSLEQLLWIGRAVKRNSRPMVAIPHKRIKFLGAGDSPTHGSAFLHFGPHAFFRNCFAEHCLMLS